MASKMKIDLRSDTVTQPSEAMRALMAQAEVGDDVYGDDPTVNRLEAMAAEKLRTEEALFLCSGTQSNLVALLSHCERGEEYIVGQKAHTYLYEAGGAAVLGSIQPQPLDFESDGTLDLQKVADAIKPDDSHFARTKLLCIENTQASKVLPLSYLKEASAFAKSQGLNIHLDGARAFNAAVYDQVEIHEISQHFDSVSICLSKGLGAPVGSILCGKQEIVSKARRWRKMVGGGMRQAGIIAAAGIYALENNVDRLSEDHENASFLRDALLAMDQFEVDTSDRQTNMVYVRSRHNDHAALTAHLLDQGILVSNADKLRLVTHLNVSRNDIERVIDAVKGFYTH